MKSGEYELYGDYHIQLDPNWPYLPVYLYKIALVRNYLELCSATEKILDAGCGEGVLVREYRERGYDILGMDLNYASEVVMQGSILATGFEDGRFDRVLCLDVLEHLSFSDQELALAEFARILKPEGKLLLSVPNLAHLASRLSFLLTGKLVRTSQIERHPGDRPIKEYTQMIEEHFRIISRTGIFPTFPLLSLLTLKIPSRVIGLHRLYNRLFAFPNWCFVNLCFCERK